jgi:transposase-like protein
MAAIDQAHFHDEAAAFAYLESTRWPEGPVCAHCGTIGTAYALKSRIGLYRCAEKACRKDFTVRVGTVFEDSPIKLHKWLLAAYLVCASKKGISSKQLERMLGVTYKTAWFMSHRLREAMNMPAEGQMGGDGGAVEVDETYWGNVGKQRPGARGGDHKMKIVSLVDRAGEKRSFHVANVTGATLRPLLAKHISPAAHLMTDEAAVYKKIGTDYSAHGSVNHGAGEYVNRIQPWVHSNTVESSFALLKRGLVGTFHSVSEQHLQRYATEFDFRWNYRIKTGYDDVQRTQMLLANIGGKRLTYRRPAAQV